MKKVGTIWSAALVLLLSFGMMLTTNRANAQFQSDELPELSRDWHVHIGMYFFQSETARKVSGSVGFSGIVERNIYTNENVDVALGIGYHGFDKVYSIPIMFNVTTQRGKWSYGGGAGYSFGKRLDKRGLAGAALGLHIGYNLTGGKVP